MTVSTALHPDDLRLLTSRFGLAGATPMTLEQLAAELGISREQVRWRETRALRAARSIPSLASRLSGDESASPRTPHDASKMTRLVF